jgi:hypothetical protein
MLAQIQSQLSFLPCLSLNESLLDAHSISESSSTKSSLLNDPQQPDPFEILTSLIGKSLPQWVPRPLSPLTSYKCTLTGLTIIQIGGGVAHCFADLYSGTYATLLGVLGFNTSRSDRHPDLFKTYLVITFINGCVQGMEVFGNILAGHLTLSLAFPFLLSNGIAYLGWLYVKKQKRLLRDPSYLSIWRARNYELIEAAYLATKARRSDRLPTIIEDEDDATVNTGSTGETLETHVIKGA